MPRATKSQRPQRHDPLHVDLEKDEKAAKYGKVSAPGRRQEKQISRGKGKGRGDGSGDEDNTGERFLDPKTSKKILNLAKIQQEQEGEATSEDSDEDDMGEYDDQAGPDDTLAGDNEGDGGSDHGMEEHWEDEEDFEGILNDKEETERRDTKGKRKLQEAPSIAQVMRSTVRFEDDDSDTGDDGADGETFMGEEYERELEIDAGDMQTLDTYLPSGAGERKTLADLIFSKFESGDLEAGKKVKVVDEEDGPPDPTAGLDPKIVEVYKKIGQLLSRYRSGPLPKPFKILPALPSWARLLAITDPKSWTPHAFNAATKLLISNLNPAQARIYLEAVLLDAVREDLRRHGRLSAQLYDAVLKATYKPAAFFKGMLFPLCEHGCTLKEAAVFASVITKISIPILHSAAAVLRLASMDYSGPVSLFIRVLLDKKYALPYKVVDGMVFHFIRIANTFKGSRTLGYELPVLWHQSLLVFVQRYGNDLTPEQKDALLDVVKARPHASIGPEIRRHIVNSVERGAPRLMEDGDVIMT